MESGIFLTNGRIDRPTYLLRLGIAIAVSVGIYFIVKTTIPPEAVFWTNMALLVVFLVFTNIQAIKRAHDLGMSGSSILSNGMFFVLLLREGQAGPNKYGESTTPEAANTNYQIRKDNPALRPNVRTNERTTTAGSGTTVSNDPDVVVVADILMGGLLVVAAFCMIYAFGSLVFG